MTPTDNITYSFWYINSKLVNIQPFGNSYSYKQIPYLIQPQQNNNEVFLYKNGELIIRYRINFIKNEIRTQLKFYNNGK